MRRTIPAATLVALACSMLGCSHYSAVLITQYREGTPRVDKVVKALSDEFDERGISCDLRVFHMDIGRHTAEIWRDEQGKRAMIFGNVYEPDIFLVDGDEAARYFTQRAVDTHRKIVFFGVKGKPADYNFVGALNVTGVRESVPVRELFTLMRMLVPSAQRVAVLSDHSLEGEAVLAQIESEADLPMPVVEVSRARTVSEWMEAVRAFQTKADVLLLASYNGVLQDTGYDTVPPDELLRMTSEANRLPDFSFWREAVGPNGVMAAKTVPPTVQAASAVSIAARILDGEEDISRIAIVTCRDCATIISKGRAARLGITLPPELEETPAPNTGP